MKVIITNYNTIKKTIIILTLMISIKCLAQSYKFNLLTKYKSENGFYKEQKIKETVTNTVQNSLDTSVRQSIGFANKIRHLRQASKVNQGDESPENNDDPFDQVTIENPLDERNE